MNRLDALSTLVFAVGVAIGVGCAGDSNAQGAERTRIIPDDTAGIARMLRVVRGSDPLVCEMATRTVDMRESWSNWGSSISGALVIDSAASALLDWVHRSHNDPVVVPLLRTGLQDADGCVRRVASSLLARVRHADATNALLAALGDPRAGTREAAAFALGMTESPLAIDPLLGRLRDDAPTVRRAAAWALGELEATKAVPALVELLARDSDARVRQTAAWAIGSIH